MEKVPYFYGVLLNIMQLPVYCGAKTAKLPYKNGVFYREISVIKWSFIGAEGKYKTTP